MPFNAISQWRKLTKPRKQISCNGEGGICRRIYSRRAIIRVLAAIALVAIIMASCTSVVSPNRRFLPNAELLHRQKIAAADLNEQSLMVHIIDVLDHQLSSIDRARIARVLIEEARHYESDPLFMVAIIITESSFGPGRVSTTGARGLMQIKPSVAQAVAERQGLRWTNADQLFDPAYNVQLGSHYLFELIARFGSVKRALIAYNCGETALNWRIETGLELPLRYFERVMSNYHVLRAQFGPQVPWKPVLCDKSL